MLKKIVIILSVILGICVISYGAMYFMAKNGANDAMKEKELVYSFEDITTKRQFQIIGIKGENYASIVRDGIFQFVTTPLIAIWLEDSQGNYLTTLYYPAKLEEIDRKAALPVWTNKIGGDLKTITQADSVSGASIANIDNSLELGLSDKVYVYIECNKSYDYNDYFKEGLEESQEGYNTDYCGQPSLIYRAEIDTALTNIITFELIGQGAADGSDGKVHELSNGITTAKDLFEKFTFQWTN